MACFKVEGGHSLNGVVKSQGSKNSSLPILAASLLSDQKIVIRGLSELSDIQTLSKILSRCGKKVSFLSSDVIELTESSSLNSSSPTELVKKMRASFLILGPLLLRTGEAAVALPGGDAIGSRPVDIHLAGLEAMGAAIEISDGIVHARANQLYPAEFTLKYPSVGATEHLMMTAAGISGRTILRNPACEPEIEDLAGFLRAMGVQIALSPDAIEICGIEELGAADHKVIPDRLYAGTIAIAAAITGGEVKIECIPEHLKPFTSKLKSAGVRLEESDSHILLNHTPKQDLRAIEIETGPYPGFPTDMQPLIMPLLALCKGTSRVTETVFEDRFIYLGELQKMGVDVQLSEQTAILNCVDKLHSADVQSLDIRAGVSLVLAGLAADGTTTVDDPDEHIARGYFDLGGDFQRLGAKITKV